MKAFLVVLSLFSGLSTQAQTPELYGFASRSSNLYSIRSTASSDPIVKLAQNELAGIVLLRDWGAVRDIYGRVTAFESSGKVLVRQALGSEFRLSENLLGVWTKSSHAKVFNRAGAEIFSTSRPVTGLTVTQHRFGWIDGWRQSLEVYDQDGKSLRQFAFVANAWMSDQFLLTRYQSQWKLYGRGFRLFPTEAATAVQLSDDLAVLTTADGRVKVYRPDGWLFTRANIRKAVLTGEYLALSDSNSVEIYRKDGSFAARYPIGGGVDYQVRTLAIRSSPGTYLLVDPTIRPSPAQKLLSGGDSLAVGPRLAVAVQNGFYDVYSLEKSRFGEKLSHGPRIADANSSAVAGYSIFGFVNPTAQSGQILVPQAPGIEASTEILDEPFVTRIDLSSEASSLNWTMF